MDSLPEGVASRIVRLLPLPLLVLVGVSAWMSSTLAPPAPASGTSVHAVDAGWIAWDDAGRCSFGYAAVGWPGLSGLSLRDPEAQGSVAFAPSVEFTPTTQVYLNGRLQSTEDSSALRVLTGQEPIGWPRWAEYECAFDGRELVVERVYSWDYILAIREYDYLEETQTWTSSSLTGEHSALPTFSPPAIIADELADHVSWARERWAEYPHEPFHMSEGRGYIFAGVTRRLSGRYDAVGTPPGGWFGLGGSGNLEGVDYRVEVRAWVQDDSVLVHENGHSDLIEHLDEGLVESLLALDFMPASSEVPLLGLLLEQDGRYVLTALVVPGIPADDAE